MRKWNEDVRGKNIRLGTIGVKPISRYVTTARRSENAPTRLRIGDKKRTLAKSIRESSRSETSASARNKARHGSKGCKVLCAWSPVSGVWEPAEAAARLEPMAAACLPPAVERLGAEAENRPPADHSTAASCSGLFPLRVLWGSGIHVASQYMTNRLTGNGKKAAESSPKGGVSQFRGAHAPSRVAVGALADCFRPFNGNLFLRSAPSVDFGVFPADHMPNFSNSV